MKNLFKIAFVSLVFVTISAFANSSSSQYSFDVHSLVGIEGGYDSFSASNSASSTSKNFGHYGVKVGAETPNYRLFFNARGYTPSNFKDVTSLGLEGQYLFGHFKVLNLFIGAGTGMMYLKTKESDFSFSHVYYSGEAGLDFHIAPMLDLSVGGRYMHIGYTGDNTQVHVSIDHIASLYTSLVYKFKMN